MAKYLLLLVICTPILAQEIDFDKLLSTKGNHTGAKILDSDIISAKEVNEAKENVPDQFSQSILGKAVESMLSADPIDSETQCFSIESDDLRDHCLAVVNRNDALCFSIKNDGWRDHCLAVVNRNDALCFSIKNDGWRDHCLAVINRNDALCFSIESVGLREHCLAAVNRNDALCFSTKSVSLNDHCVATYGWY